MRLLVTAALVAVALASAAPAFAQAPTRADEEAAKSHFLAGSAYYEQANYSDAVREFNEAHRLSKRPDLLYNISVCYERLGRWDDAIAALRQYLVERPEAPDRVVIETRIKNFTERRDQELAQQQQQQEQQTPPPIIAPTPVVVTPTRPRHVASWIVGGIGAGLLVAALGTGVTAQIAYKDLQQKCGGFVCNGNDQMLKDEQSFGRALTISTDVLIGVGAATLLTGVILFIVEARRPAPAHAQLSPARGGLQVAF
jgi:tetratricopeptide (TPR) repeat protein